MYILVVEGVSTMYTTIQRWGNSQGLRIPKTLLEALGIRENDRVELTQAGDSITVRKAVFAPHKTLEERLTAFYGVPAEQVSRIGNQELDYGKSEGSEKW